MQIRSFRGSGEPAWVIASSNARDGLGPDPRRALGPAAVHAASTGRTRDRTRPTLQQRQKVLAKAPSTRDPKPTYPARKFKTNLKIRRPLLRSQFGSRVRWRATCPVKTGASTDELGPHVIADAPNHSICAILGGPIA